MLGNKAIGGLEKRACYCASSVSEADQSNKSAMWCSNFQHSLGARASRTIGADQLNSASKLAHRYLGKEARRLRRRKIFHQVTGHSTPATDPFATETTLAIVYHDRFIKSSGGLIFLLHLWVAFSETIRAISMNSVKFIFLLLILCAAPLQAEEVVRAAQTRLAALGYYKAGVDGSSGSMTSAAIRRFQLAEKLKVTGSLNQQTLDALGVKTPPPAPEYSKISALFEGGPLSGKDSAAQVEAIRHVQRLLAEAGFYAGPHNGLPSATLTSSIREWQTANDLRQTGKLDARTLAGLGVAGN